MRSHQPGDRVPPGLARDRDPRPGRLLRDVRAGAGLTQREVAARAGVPQSMVSAYESGTRQPTVPVLGRLLEAMGQELSLQTWPLPASLVLLEGPIGRRVRRNRDRLLELAAGRGVYGLAVFGPTARGEEGPGSALELLVQADGVPMVQLLVLSAELTEVLGARVDLVSTGQLSSRQLALITPELVCL